MIQNGIQIYFTCLSVSWELTVQTWLKLEHLWFLELTQNEWIIKAMLPSNTEQLKYVWIFVLRWQVTVRLTTLYWHVWYDSRTTCNANYIMWTMSAMLQSNLSISSELFFIFHIFTYKVFMYNPATTLAYPNIMHKWIRKICLYPQNIYN